MKTAAEKRPEIRLGEYLPHAGTPEVYLSRWTFKGWTQYGSALWVCYDGHEEVASVSVRLVKANWYWAISYMAVEAPGPISKWACEAAVYGLCADLNGREAETGMLTWTRAPGDEFFVEGRYSSLGWRVLFTLAEVVGGGGVEVFYTPRQEGRHG